MHKTVNVSIGNTLFVIEESAYARLDAYLHSVRSHFAGTPDAEEIVSDIEDRIAEEFSEKLSSKKKVILLKDVEDLIRSMGTVEDFEKYGPADDSADRTKTGAPPQRVRLYRDPEDQILGGVCSGIARYFAIDPVIVRLAFGLSLLVGGFGFILYILLWIILPEARTTAEKVEMTGGKVTLSAIQKRIEEAVKPEQAEKAKSMLRKIVTFPVLIITSILRVIGKILRFVIPLLVRLVGVAATLGTAFWIAGATFVFFALLLNPTSPYIGFPIREAVGATSYVILLLSGYVLVVVPLVIILIVAASLIVLRNQLRLPAITALGATWFMFLVLGGVTMFSAAPAIEVAADRYAQEHNSMETRDVDLKNFTGIKISGTANTWIEKGDAFGVKLQGSVEELRRAKLTVENGVLTLVQEYKKDRCYILCVRSGLGLMVTMPSLTSIDVSGSSKAFIEAFDERTLTLKASGASSVTAHMNATVVNSVLSGASQAGLWGSGSVLTLEASGASQYDGIAYSVTNATVDLSGASQAVVRVSDLLEGELTGASHVYYREEPKTVDVSTSGASSIEQVDEDWYRWHDDAGEDW